MCRRRGQFLSSALALCIANEALMSFATDSEDLHRATERGIKVIADLRTALRRITGKEDMLFRTRLEDFDSYEQMKMLKAFVTRTKWSSWDSDLEQWLANRESLIEKFTQLNHEFLWADRNEGGDCF